MGYGLARPPNLDHIVGGVFSYSLHSNRYPILEIAKYCISIPFFFFFFFLWKFYSFVCSTEDICKTLQQLFSTQIRFH